MNIDTLKAAIALIEQMGAQTSQCARLTFTRYYDNGKVVGPDGCHYKTEAEAMWFCVAHGCGCGCPEDVHKFLCRCLSAFDRRGNKWGEGTGVDAIKQAIAEQPDEAAEFIAHVLYHLKLTEHETNVYGSWLTPLGEQFLEVGPMIEAEEGND